MKEQIYECKKYSIMMKHPVDLHEGGWQTVYIIYFYYTFIILYVGLQIVSLMYACFFMY